MRGGGTVMRRTRQHGGQGGRQQQSRDECSESAEPRQRGCAAHGVDASGAALIPNTIT